MKENIGSFQRRPVEPLLVLDREGIIVLGEKQRRTFRPETRNAFNSERLYSLFICAILLLYDSIWIPAFTINRFFHDTVKF